MISYFNLNRQYLLKTSAASWCGTPFRDHWRTRGIGVDCIQLAVALYLETGLLNEFTAPPYTIGAWKGLRASPVVEWIENCPCFRKIESGEHAVGDLLCFTHGRVVYHLGVYLDDGSQLFIHAISGEGVMKRTLLDPTWAKRFVASYRPIQTA
jgi:hypothetical protein